jgi:hypothetical protein
VGCLEQLVDAGTIDREKRGAYAYLNLSDGSLERIRRFLELPPSPRPQAPVSLGQSIKPA